MYLARVLIGFWFMCPGSASRPVVISVGLVVPVPAASSSRATQSISGVNSAFWRNATAIAGSTTDHRFRSHASIGLSE